MSNEGSSYAYRQRAIKRQLTEQQRKAKAAAREGAAASGGSAGAAAAAGTSAGAAATPAAPAAAAPAQQPDDDKVFQRKWKAMRDQAMADLQAALTAALRQAVRFRGLTELALAPPEAPAAAQLAGDA